MTDKNVIGDTAPEGDIPEDNAKAADGSGWKQWSLIKRFRFVWNGKFIMSSCPARTSGGTLAGGGGAGLS